jgi:fatty-acyl-CoA synthase
MSSNLSYVCGATDVPLLYQTVGDLLSASAEKWPDREAPVLCHQDVRMTYAELNSEVDNLARGLLASGLSPGDRVGIWSPNCAEWILTQYATARAGLILVTINPAYRLAEIQFALQKVSCAALLLASSFKKSDYIGMVRSLIPDRGREPSQDFCLLTQS